MFIGTNYLTKRIFAGGAERTSSRTIVKVYKLTLAACVAGSLVFHLAIMWASAHHIAGGYGDFIIFYTGAQIINDGKSKELFKVETQNAYQAKFEVPQLEWPLPFNHAPYELVLFLPLVHFSYPVAHAIWSGANLILVLIMLVWLVAYANSPYGFFIAAAVFAWFPTMETFRLGQDSILSTALLLAVFVALKHERDTWAGFLLAIGLYKPQLALPMAGLFFVARRWRSVAAFGMTGAILAVFSFAMVGWQGILDWVSILKSMDRYSWIIHPANMPNIRGLLYDWFQPGTRTIPVFIVTVVISVVLYTVTIYLWRGEINVLDPDFDLKFSLAIVTSLLVSYHLYSHDLFPLVLSLVLTFRYIITEGAIHRVPPTVFFFLLIVLFIPLVPRYLIEFSMLGWGALLLVALYSILVAEIFCRKQINIGARQACGETEW
jgi:hypothetical protein